MASTTFHTDFDNDDDDNDNDNDVVKKMIRVDARSSPTYFANRLTELWVTRLGFAVSITLGIGQAAALTRSGEFLKIVGAAVCVVALSVMLERYAAWREHTSVFVLGWRFVRKMATFAQDFAAMIAVTIVTLKLLQEDTHTSTSAMAGATVFGFSTTNVFARIRLGAASHDAATEFFITALVYASIFVIIVAFTLLYQWHVEQAEQRAALLEKCNNDKPPRQVSNAETSAILKFHLATDVVPPWHHCRTL